MGRQITEDEVRTILRARVDQAGPSFKQWALRHGFTTAFISAVLKGKKRPSVRMCEALGIRKAVEYSLPAEAAE